MEVPTKYRARWSRGQLQVAAGTVKQVQTCVQMASATDAPYMVILDEADKLFSSPERAEVGFLKSVLTLIGFDNDGTLLERRPAMVILASATNIPVLFQMPELDISVPPDDILKVN